MKTKEKLTCKKLALEFSLWNRSTKILRFGQYICNNYGITNPDIFYEEDHILAYLKLNGLILNE